VHELVSRISEPELCYVFARNANRKGHPDLALQAVRRAVDLRAEQHAPADEAERAALRAIYAYEEALTHLKGKRTRATGTWQLVSRHGVFPALAKRLGARSGKDVTSALQALDLLDYSFEAVRDAYPVAFARAA
jgi:hypothetical protein